MSNSVGALPGYQRSLAQIAEHDKSTYRDRTKRERIVALARNLHQNECGTCLALCGLYPTLAHSARDFNPHAIALTLRHRQSLPTLSKPPWPTLTFPSYAVGIVRPCVGRGPCLSRGSRAFGPLSFPTFPLSPHTHTGGREGRIDGLEGRRLRDRWNDGESGLQGREFAHERIRGL